MLATTNFNLSLNDNIYAILNEKFNKDKNAINVFLNNFLNNNLIKKLANKKNALNFDDLNKETQNSLSNGEYEKCNTIDDIWK